MGIKFRMTVVASVAAGLFGLAGCASVPLAPVEQDAAAKQFLTAPGKARIYLYRDEGFGAAITMPVIFDGRAVGQTAARTYFFWEVDPGRHTLASLTQNTSTVEVDARADGVYYVWQEVKMGAFTVRSDLQLVDEATGRKGVQSCKLAQPQTY